jgi:hypothetical protein
MGRCIIQSNWRTNKYTIRCGILDWVKTSGLYPFSQTYKVMRWWKFLITPHFSRSLVICCIVEKVWTIAIFMIIVIRKLWWLIYHILLLIYNCQLVNAHWDKIVSFWKSIISRLILNNAWLRTNLIIILHEFFWLSAIF